MADLCLAKLKGGRLCQLPAFHDGDHDHNPGMPVGSPGGTQDARGAQGAVGGHPQGSAPVSGDSPGPAMPPLVPGPHGGALYRGGVPGNRGGRRPANVVRAAMREAFDERVPLLAGIADGEVHTRLVGTCSKCGHRDQRALTEAELRAAVPSIADRIYALRTLGMFSDLKDGGLPDDGLMQELGQAVVDAVGPEPWAKIEAAWVEILSRRIR